MIEQLQFVLTPPEGVRVPQAYAYRLYGWLLEQLSSELGDTLHEQGEHPVSQFLYFSPERQALVWTVNLLTDELRQAAVPILEQVQQIQLHDLPLHAELLSRAQSVSAQQLICAGRDQGANRAKLTFRSPCAFKQSGRYAIYPQETLVLQSLIQHWNSAFPECALTDPDAFQALAQGLRILDYDLRTTRYLLKEARIPAFRGSMTLEARLAPPLLALWNALLTFAPFGGTGIKTTLGMGGTEAEFIPARFPDGHRAAL